MTQPGLQVCSDLHIDLVSSRLWPGFIEPRGSHLVLAGDICPINQPHLMRKFLRLWTPHFRHIYLINGNHEYYAGKRRRPVAVLHKMQDQLLSEFSNVTVLRDQVVEISELNVRLIGSTLWSAIPEAAQDQVRAQINDYCCIFAAANQRLTPAVSSAWHAVAAWSRTS